MDTFDDCFGLWVLDCGRRLESSKAVQKLLKLKTDEFAALVKNCKKRTRVTQHPNSIKGKGDGLRTFVRKADDLNPTSSDVNDCEHEKREITVFKGSMIRTRKVKGHGFPRSESRISRRKMSIMLAVGLKALAFRTVFDKGSDSGT